MDAAAALTDAAALNAAAALTAAWREIVPNVSGRRIGDDYEFALRPSVESEETIIVVLARLHERGGSPQADVTAWWGLNGQIPPRTLPLFQDQIFLNSGRDRDRLAGRLGRFAKRSAPWAEWAEAICFTARGDWEQGEPLQTLATVSVQASMPYLLFPLLPEGETTLLYGDGETGKSLLAMFVAVAVATGAQLPYLELRGAPAPVLYLDWETNAQIAARRLAAISNGFAIAPPATVYYRRMARALFDDLRTVRAEADRCGAALVIIDSLGAACGGSPSKEELIVPFFNAVRSLKRTALLISHLSKVEAGLDGNKATPIGSVYSRNLARATWLVRRAEGEAESSQLFIGVWHTKGNESRRFRPLGFGINFGEGRVTIHGVAADEVPSLAVHLPIQQRVRTALLDAGKATAAELAATLGIAESTVRAALNRLPDSFVIERGGPRRPSVWAIRAREDSHATATAR